MSGKRGYEVVSIGSLAGEALILKRGITRRDIPRVIEEYRKREGVCVGTVISVNDDGIVGSEREGWHPGLPGAFAKPFIIIPWVQVLDLLGRVPEGTTDKLLDAGESPATRSITVSDTTYRAIAEEAILPFRSTATRQQDGRWLVPVADDTWERLQQHRLPGETDDDVVMRLISQYRGDKPN
ncbi:MAG: hypothetical protein ACK4NA_06895 [Alphaproteobacteria bacterium]